MRPTRLLLLLTLALPASGLVPGGPVCAEDAPNLLENGDFARWKDGAPEGWSVTTGAKSGEGEISTLEPLPDGGIALVATKQTRIWKFVAQDFEAPAGTSFRLDFEARARGLDRGPSQFTSCYVGFVFFAEGGRRLGFAVRDVHNADWRPEIHTVRAPEGAVRAQIAVFMSLTGRLEVRNLRLRRLEPGDSFQTLVDDMARYYSFFDLKEIDWDTVVARHRKTAEAAEGPAAFAAAIVPMLAELKDLHVSVVTPDGKRIPTHRAAPPGNYDFGITGLNLKGVHQIGRIAFTGRTQEGYGYLALGTLVLDEKSFAAIDGALAGLLDAPALILDLRANHGGNEVWAQKLAGRFTRERVLYAKQTVRTGPAAGDLGPSGTRMLVPRGGTAYERPIACLVGPHCVSSGEGFAMMMKALPHCVLVGLPTRGASANPQPVSLPNGVTVHYSRWISLLPDGTPIEDRGVAPDVEVPPLVVKAASVDRTLDAARAELRKRLASEPGK